MTAILLMSLSSLLPALASESRPAATQPSPDDVAFRKCFEILQYEFYVDPTDHQCKPLPGAVRDFCSRARAHAASAIRECAKDLATVKKQLGLDQRERQVATREIRQELIELRQFKNTPHLTPPPERAYPPWLVPTKGRSGTLIWFRVRQVVDKNTMIIASRDGNVSWLNGYPTAGVTDDSNYTARIPVCVTGTKQYTTVLGGTNTIPLLTVIPLVIYTGGITEAQLDGLLKRRGIEKGELIEAMESAKKLNRRDPGEQLTRWILQHPER